MRINMKNTNENAAAERCELDDYRPILCFSQEHNNIDYVKFDYFVVNSVGLFAVHENYDFAAAEQVADVIIKALPAIKRIFSKPVIHLKDSSEILPVESVHIVNAKTVMHASVHSEIWENKSAGGIRPRKLLTINNQDNYSIYENIAFAKAIDLIMIYLRRNIRILREILYSDKGLDFNLLDRTNHLNYYLAIGKLHTGYVRNYNTYCESAERCLSKMNYIYNTINTRLNCPVYKKCCKLTKNFTLKSTNILMMHRDYHRIYLLLKYFISLNKEIAAVDGCSMEGAGYFEFCEILTIFSVGQFGFLCDEGEKIDFAALSITFKFANTVLYISTKIFDGQKVISLSFDGGKKYDIFLVPCFDGVKEFSNMCADEIIPIYPDMNGEGIRVSISDIDSFRRIQQIILRGMVYADVRKKICPFCSRELVGNTDSLTGRVFYECRACRTIIKSEVCPTQGREYFVTEIKNFSTILINDRAQSVRNNWEYKKCIESAMYYRNILPYDGTGFVCPYCSKVHK